jgi:anti-sigma regulatory factor (Ser/Thr protein kinase)
MVRKSRINKEIMDFILEHVERHPRNIARLATERFAIPRQTASRYLRALVADGLLSAAGATNARRYALRDYVARSFRFEVNPEVEEHVIWRNYAAPLLTDVPTNVREICEHGVNEMVNNIIFHSHGTSGTISIKNNLRRVKIDITDSGIGIFENIRQAYMLDDPRLALLELSKGKLTTDPDGHSGEGIFFTSRMFDKFTILSGNLYYAREMQDDSDWLIEVETRVKDTTGTIIGLEISKSATQTVEGTFVEYEHDQHGFSVTHVPVRLAIYGDEQLISRSQARRVLARFEKFSEVMLDFRDVPRIGQAFADEIFRVFRRDHPDIRIVPVRMSQQVQNMIQHVIAGTTTVASTAEMVLEDEETG